MTDLFVGTSYIEKNEPCLGLFETNESVPRKGRRRIQKFYVLRDDQIAEYRKDMGASSRFGDAKPLMVIGGTILDRSHFWETVDTLKAHADDMRGNTPFTQEELPEIYEYLDRHEVGKTGTD